MIQFRNMLKEGALLSGAALLALTPLAVSAQTKAKETATQRSETERANTARLNAEQAAKSRMEGAAYQARVDNVVATEQRNEAVFESETAQYEQEKAEAAQHAAAERLQWEADVKACEAGDKSRCGTTPPADPK